MINAKTKNAPQKVENLISVIFLMCICVLILAVILLSWVPPVSRDALTHHLAVPKIYLQHGGMVELPYIPFSYFPMNLDLLYMVPLYFGNDIIPKLIHFLFGLLTAGIIYGYVKKRFGSVYALFGVLFFLSLPVIIKLSITIYVDLGLVFFSTAALLALFKWGQDKRKYKYFIFSAVYCGLALGTKYNGLVTFFILTIFVPYIYLRSGGGQSVRQGKAVGLAVGYAIIALAIFSPWMLRNTLWTGNPIFPLYNSVFSSASAHPVDGEPSEIQKEIEKRTQDWNHLAVRRIIYGESWGQIALVPIRIFFQGQDDTPQYFDGKLNPFLLFLPFMAFFPKPKLQSYDHLERNMLLFFVILFLLFSFFRTSIRIRYIAPVIPALIILSCLGVKNLVALIRAQKRSKTVLAGSMAMILAAALLFGMNTDYLIQMVRKVDPFSYISGRLGRDEYIAKFRPEYPVVKYANQNLKETDKILGLFLGNRRYYCDRKLIFGENKLTRSIILASTSESVLKSFHNKGYTHVIVHLGLLKQWAGSLDARERKVAADFFTHDMVLLKQNQHYALFVLNDLAY